MDVRVERILMRATWIALGGFAVGVVSMTLLHHPAQVTSPSGRPVSFAEQELDRIVAKVDLMAVPFDRAVEDVRKLTRAEIRIDENALRNTAFDRKTPITMHGTDVLLAQVLEQLCATAPATHPLAYDVVEGRILITTAEHVADHPTVQCYDVRDLLKSPTIGPDPDDGPMTIVPIAGKTTGERSEKCDR
jgi:hypothetical protein